MENKNEKLGSNFQTRSFVFVFVFKNYIYKKSDSADGPIDTKVK